jgi:hypothetical protein
VDVVRAAVSEIERYERVRIAALPPHAHIAGFAADDLSHLLAELLENATSFSPPDLPVEISGWLLENGEVMISVQDEGIGMAEDRLERLNSRLADFDPEAPYDQEGEDGLGLGLYVVARLAHRHGVRVQLREQKQGGVAAVVVLPRTLLAAAPAAAVPASGPLSGTTHTVAFPGADAEANSNVLHGRASNGDPLVALAEQAVRHEEAVEEAEHHPEPAPAETPAETTMELLAPIPQDEPAPAEHEPAAADGESAPQGPLALDGETRTGGAGGNDTAGGGEAEAEHERAPDDEEDRVTDKGLPKRTPKITAPTTAPRQSSGSVDAEALRRRLGGFRQGAQAGYREVEAEIAGKTASHRRPDTGTAQPAESEEATGGTVEEASS